MPSSPNPSKLGSTIGSSVGASLLASSLAVVGSKVDESLQLQLPIGCSTVGVTIGAALGSTVGSKVGRTVGKRLGGGHDDDDIDDTANDGRNNNNKRRRPSDSSTPPRAANGSSVSSNSQSSPPRLAVPTLSTPPPSPYSPSNSPSPSSPPPAVLSSNNKRRRLDARPAAVCDHCGSLLEEGGGTGTTIPAPSAATAAVEIDSRPSSSSPTTTKSSLARGTKKERQLRRRRHRNKRRRRKTIATAVAAVLSAEVGVMMSSSSSPSKSIMNSSPGRSRSHGRPSSSSSSSSSLAGVGGGVGRHTLLGGACFNLAQVRHLQRTGNNHDDDCVGMSAGHKVQYPNATMTSSASKPVGRLGTKKREVQYSSSMCDNATRTSQQLDGDSISMCRPGSVRERQPQLEEGKTEKPSKRVGTTERKTTVQYDYHHNATCAVPSSQLRTSQRHGMADKDEIGSINTVDMDILGGIMHINSNDSTTTTTSGSHPKKKRRLSFIPQRRQEQVLLLSDKNGIGTIPAVLQSVIDDGTLLVLPPYSTATTNPAAGMGMDWVGTVGDATEGKVRNKGEGEVEGEKGGKGKGSNLSTTADLSNSGTGGRINARVQQEDGGDDDGADIDAINDTVMCEEKKVVDEEEEEEEGKEEETAAHGNHAAIAQPSDVAVGYEGTEDVRMNGVDVRGGSSDLASGRVSPDHLLPDEPQAKKKETGKRRLAKRMDRRQTLGKRLSQFLRKTVEEDPDLLLLAL